MAIVTASTTKNIVRVHVRRAGVVTGASTPLIVKVGTPRVKVIAVARRGLAGADGSNGTGTTDITKIAATALGGHRAVVGTSATDAGYADNQTPAHKNLILGVTTGAASMDASVSIKTFGEMTEPSWNWTPGNLIFVGTNGLLTETVPSSGFICVIGAAISATTIFVRIRQPINLGV